MNMVCEKCGRNPQEGVTLHRTGLKGPGKDPHWRCQSHMDIHDIDPIVLDVVSIIEKAQTPPSEIH